MTTINEAREATYERFNTLWNNSTPVAFPNDGTDLRKGKVPWVRLSVRHDESAQDTLGRKGNRKYVREGTIAIQIFTLADTGLRPSDILVEQIRPIFEGEKYSGVVVNNVVNREVGIDGKWYQVNVDCFFEYYQTR